MQDCYFPFTFEFESYVKEFTVEHMRSVTGASATIVFHHNSPSNLRKVVDEELQDFGIPPLANINIWKKPPGYEQVLHADLYAWDVLRKKTKVFTVNHSAFNIPIEGTVNSDMLWYGGQHQCVPTTIITPTNTTATYFKIEWEETPFIKARLELLESHLIATSTPHQVICNPFDTRIITSLRFQGNPTFNQIQNKLLRVKKDY
jgi:hypothetical protein